MKTVTTTREFDGDGNCVKETVVEQDYVTTACTCGWYADLYYTPAVKYCPIHGYRTITVTCSGGTYSGGLTTSGTGASIVNN